MCQSSRVIQRPALAKIRPIHSQRCLWWSCIAIRMGACPVLLPWICSASRLLIPIVLQACGHLLQPNAAQAAVGFPAHCKHLASCCRLVAAQ